MKPNFNGRLFAGAVLAAAMILLSACVSNTSAQGSTMTCDPNEKDANVDVNIIFDGQGCPKEVNNTDFCISKLKKIVWQAVDTSGKPIDKIDYNIYFHPFVGGKPLESKNAGKLTSPPFDNKAPATADGIEYKYSIVGANCLNAPLDPRFRLR